MVKIERESKNRKEVRKMPDDTWEVDEDVWGVPTLSSDDWR